MAARSRCFTDVVETLFLCLTRWWFQTSIVFIPTCGDDPIGQIFFGWFETTNYLIIGRSVPLTEVETITFYIWLSWLSLAIAFPLPMPYVSIFRVFSGHDWRKLTRHFLWVNCCAQIFCNILACSSAALPWDGDEKKHQKVWATSWTQQQSERHFQQRHLSSVLLPAWKSLAPASRRLRNLPGPRALPGPVRLKVQEAVWLSWVERFRWFSQGLQEIDRVGGLNTDMMSSFRLMRYLQHDFTSELLDLGSFFWQAEAFCWCCKAVRACFMDGDVVHLIEPDWWYWLAYCFKQMVCTVLSDKQFHWICPDGHALVA